MRDPFNNPNTNYVLYLPKPGSLSAPKGPSDTSAKRTVIVIFNPNSIHVEFRTGDWYADSQTNTISKNPNQDFGSLTSSVTVNDTLISFVLYTDSSNSNQKAWFKE